MSFKLGELEFENFILKGDEGVWAMHHLETIAQLKQELRLSSASAGIKNESIMSLLEEGELKDTIIENENEIAKIEKVILSIDNEDERKQLQEKLQNLKMKATNVLLEHARKKPEIMRAMIEFQVASNPIKKEIDEKITNAEIEFLKNALVALGKTSDDRKKLSNKNRQELIKHLFEEEENLIDHDFLDSILST